MAHLALLEDDTDLRQEMVSYLVRYGHALSEAGTLAAFRALRDAIDIAIIDLGLPDGSGLDAAAWLREQRPRAGIIILTARGTTTDKLAGLRGGADHYLVKPFRLDELAAIIDALLRRLGVGWRIDPQLRLLLGPEGTSIALSPAEMAMFEQFADHPDQVVKRRNLVEAFGERWLEFDQRRLDTMISRLRSRWREATGGELPLKTEYRQGYSFGATIHRV